MAYVPGSDPEFDEELHLAQLYFENCFVCHRGELELRFTLSHLIREFNIPVDNEAFWVMQHWQGFPRPALGEYDQREFGYFICEAGKIFYEPIPWEKIEIRPDVIIRPIQRRRRYIPGLAPVAVNYFPNSWFTSKGEKWILERKS